MENSLINPMCATCGDLIGDMPLDIYLRAVEVRGPFLLCPNCRLHWCDCCGWLVPHQETREYISHSGQFLGKACETCQDFVLKLSYDRSDFPHFRILKKPNINFVRAGILSSKSTSQANRGEK